MIKAWGEDDVKAVLEVRKIPLGKEKNDFFFSHPKAKKNFVLLFSIMPFVKF